MTDPTISALSSMAQAIDVMQLDVDRSVVVIDSERHVVGILTEGDIVRAVRRGVLLEAVVATVVTGQATVTTRPFTDAQLAYEFSERGTLLIPLVDAERKLISVQRSRDAVSRLLGAL